MFMAFGCYCHADKLVSHFANRQIAKAANSKERQTNKQPHKKQIHITYSDSDSYSDSDIEWTQLWVCDFAHNFVCVFWLSFMNAIRWGSSHCHALWQASEWQQRQQHLAVRPPIDGDPLHSTLLRSALIWSDPSKSLLALPAFIISSKFVFSRFMAMSSRRCRCRSTCSGQIGVQFIKMKFSLLLHIL